MDFLSPKSFAPHPFSLQEIAATHVKVPCKTKVELKGFGYLDPSLGLLDLPAGSELELPLWSVQILAKKGYVTVRVPNRYRGQYRDAVKAAPSVVDLNRLGPHYYQTGLHLAALPTPDSDEIADLLPDMFRDRLIPLADSYDYVNHVRTVGGGNTTNDGGPATGLINENHLDALEKSILEESRKGSKLMVMYFQKR